MKIDIHAHYLPRESLKIAQEIGKRYNMQLSQDEKGAIRSPGRLSAIWGLMPGTKKRSIFLEVEEV